MNDYATSILQQTDLLLKDVDLVKIINNICDQVFHANAQTMLTDTFTAPAIKDEIDLFVGLLLAKGYKIPVCKTYADYESVYTKTIYPLKEKMLKN